LIGLYIGQSDPGSAFGAAGALAVLLVWIYYAAIILLLGAEFTQAWMKLHGRTIEPEKGAVRIVEVKKRVTGSSTKNPREEESAESDCLRDDATPRVTTGSERDGTGGEGENVRVLDGEATDELARVQHAMAVTRDRTSGTLAATESRASAAADGIKDGLDASKLVKEHPWPALAAAVVAGVALSATRADETVRGTTVQAAKRAS
jgi:hypothetical protein